MNIRFWAKVGIIMGSILVGAFVLLLLSPLILNFAIDKYTPQIVGEINKATGLSAGLEDIRIVTAPKFTAGLKVKKFELYTPQKEPVLIADNFEVKMSLASILAKSVRIDVIKLDNAEITLKMNKDGSLEIEQYFPKQEQAMTEDKEQEPFVLPLGLKLSNHLPDIHINGYKATIIDGNNNYVLEGGKTDITDFIINKSVKVATSGKFTLKDREQFNYRVKLLNKIMPDVELNDLVFNPQPQDNKKPTSEPFNITEILKGIYEYKLTANADIDLKTAPDSIDGTVNISNVSLIDLPKSKADLGFKGNTINVVSDIYTAANEVSKLNGKITTGKKPFVDMNLKSDVELANVLGIVKKVALIFNIKDLQTLSANGRLNANFNIKSDTKTVNSGGYLKVPSAKVYYGLYNIGIDNINADVNLDNNNVNIKNISFSVFGQPLKMFGTLTQNAVSDIHVIADKLSIKGLLVALGQASILKENPIYSGTVSMDAIIKGKLDQIKPVIKLNIANIDLKNIPSDIRVKAPSTSVNITSDGVTFGGNALSNNIMLINPALKVLMPQVKANIKEDVIEITQTPVTIENIKTNVSGKITNYLTEKIGLDFVTTGDIKSTLKGDMNTSKQTLNLTYATTELSTIVIPLFDKSKLSFTGKIGITGSMMNPILSGTANVPTVSIPEIPVTMSGMDVKLNGTILHGSATVKEFTSGGIKAENISSDFELKGNDFYLNNLKGQAFDGKISGDILYNIANAKTKIDFKGEKMNAEKAIEGAAGIKKALTGTLGFNTKLTLTVLDYNAMMKSMKGDLSFDVKNGAFGSIGRFEGLLGAANIVNNAILKNTVASITNATGLTNTATFDKIEGYLTFSDGWANLNSVKSTGKALCYYVTGKYNLVNGTTNVVVLGRLDAPMVAKLGALGELSASKLLSYIPKFGSATANVLSLLTSNPNGEKVDQIPALSNGSTNYKDFKVTFNGGIESKSSIKSFKWLSNPDMSEMETKTVKETVEDIKSAIDTDIKSNIDRYNNAVETQKQFIKDTKEEINARKEEFKNTANDIKNLFKSFKEPLKTTEPEAATTAPAETTTSTSTTTAPANSNNSGSSSSSNATSSSSTPSASGSTNTTPAPSPASATSNSSNSVTSSAVETTSAPVQTETPKSEPAPAPAAENASASASESENTETGE